MRSQPLFSAQRPEVPQGALEEILSRFRDWDVDLGNAKLSATSTVRGWDTLPAFIS